MAPFCSTMCLLSTRSLLFIRVLLVGAIASEAYLSRQLSFEDIGGYSPLTKITDYAAVDLDQQEIESYITTTEKDFKSALSVYSSGAHSRSYATMRLQDRAPFDIAEGTHVVGVDSAGNEVVGRALADVAAGGNAVSVLYETADTHSNYANCQVGGSPTPNLAGCFVSEGSLSIDGKAFVSYKYQPDKENLNGRTIQGFSLAASEQMRQGTNGDYYPDFQKYFDYYGAADYADQWVSAALKGDKTNMQRGNAVFRNYAEEGLEEAVKRGTVYLNIFMQVIGELEDAIDDCEQGCGIDECNEDIVNSVDAAVALYAGSLLVTESDNGILLYALAETQCRNFNTCTSELSAVNQLIFSQLALMQENIRSNICAEARSNKEIIARTMYIPLIQGAILAAYFHSELGVATERMEGRGATFAAAILPAVHACSPGDAEIIYENMQIGRDSAGNFSAVKWAFERNYACMGVTCADIGGVWNRATDQYFAGALPCNNASPPETPQPTSSPSSPKPSPTRVPTSGPIGSGAPTNKSIETKSPTQTTGTVSPTNKSIETKSPTQTTGTVAPTFLETKAPSEGKQIILAGYSSSTNTRDAARIDLDYDKLADQVALRDLSKARVLYAEGGHSEPFAVLTLVDPASTGSFVEGTGVFGWSDSGRRVSGSLLEDAAWYEVGADGITVKVLYDIVDTDQCQVGGLVSISAANRDGCFSESGSISLGGLDESQNTQFNYTYNIRRDNMSNRTIQKFSTEEAMKFHRCNSNATCVFYYDIQQFVDYYGIETYANRWVLSAVRGENTELQSGRGNADFASLTTEGARGEAMQLGALILNVWMAVVGELENAIDACRRPCSETLPGTCNAEALKDLDTAVAYYVGSLELDDGSGDGVLLYDLADRAAQDFRTGGSSGLETSGTSFINLGIIRSFNELQRILQNGEDGNLQCDAAEAIKRVIVNLMKVPLVQGTLRVAWKRSVAGESDTETNRAEGATFAASILPYVYACKRSSATGILYSNLGLSSENVDFPRLRDELESLYDCLGVTCKQVGGIWNGESFEEGAEPCIKPGERDISSTKDAAPTDGPPSATMTNTSTWAIYMTFAAVFVGFVLP